MQIRGQWTWRVHNDLIRFRSCLARIRMWTGDGRCVHAGPTIWWWMLFSLLLRFSHSLSLSLSLSLALRVVIVITAMMTATTVTVQLKLKLYIHTRATYVWLQSSVFRYTCCRTRWITHLLLYNQRARESKRKPSGSLFLFIWLRSILSVTFFYSYIRCIIFAYPNF